MPTWTRTRWLACWLIGALAFAGCAADTSTTTGDLTIELELSDGSQIEEVSYAVTGGDMPAMVGTINTSAPGSTASLEIYGIPGGGPYNIMMTATTVDGETSCTGDADFHVEVGLVTEVSVMLNCKPGQELGGVRVNGSLNYCTDLIKVVVAPLQTSIGNQIDVAAIALDMEGDPIEYRWTGTGGTFANPNAAETTYTCQELGDQTITITVSDDGFDYCDCNHTVDITCVDGGGTGGTGGMAGAGGMGGMAGEGGMGGMAGQGGMGGMAGQGGMGGMAGQGGMGGMAGQGGMGGMAGQGGMGGMAGEGGMGGMAGQGGMGGMAGQGGMGGSGQCIPDGGAQYAGVAVNRICGEVTCGAMEVCVDQACTPSALIFVSSTWSDAALGGPRGADRTCADLAEAAGLGGYWMSWTSDPCTSPFKRFEKSTLPYRMLDGVSIASDWDRLTNRPADDFHLENDFNMDEYGDLPGPIANPGTVCPSTITTPPGCTVWTNTDIEGRVAALANNNGCLGLTSDDSLDAPSDVGQMTSRGRNWTEGPFRNCGIDGGRLFCFEQSVAEPDPGVP